MFCFVREPLLQYVYHSPNVIIHNFSVWLGTGSNPADINRFRILTRNAILRLIYNYHGGRKQLAVYNTSSKVL